MWFDLCIEEPEYQPYRKAFAAYYYNRGARMEARGVAINYKQSRSRRERRYWISSAAQLRRSSQPVLADRYLGGIEILGLHSERPNYRTSGFDRATNWWTSSARTAALLLNIGPRPDGPFPSRLQDILLAIGDGSR